MREIITEIKKTRTIKPTRLQKLALDRIVENRGRLRKSMREAGYALNTAKNPINLTESKGFNLLCEERGLTDELLIDALVEDIKKKPQNRKQELELGFKVKGKLKEENEQTTNIFAIFANDQRERIIRRSFNRLTGSKRTSD